MKKIYIGTMVGRKGCANYLCPQCGLLFVGWSGKYTNPICPDPCNQYMLQYQMPPLYPLFIGNTIGPVRMIK